MTRDHYTDPEPPQYGCLIAIGVIVFLGLSLPSLLQWIF